MTRTRIALLTSLAFALGAAVSKTLFEARQKSETEFALSNARTHLGQILGNETLQGYYALKDSKLRCEKSDELLGQLILIALADLGLKTSKFNLEMAKVSAEKTGVFELASSPSLRPGAAENPLPEVSPPSPEVSPSTAVTIVSHGPGYVALEPPEDRGTRGCDKGAKPGWFMTGEAPKDYRISVEPPGSDGEAVAFIEARENQVRPQSAVLEHCLAPPFKPGDLVTLTAQVRSEAINGYANLHLRAENSHREVIQYRKVSVSTGPALQWKPVSVQLEIPPDTVLMSYGMLLESGGKLSIKNVVIKTVTP